MEIIKKFVPYKAFWESVFMVKSCTGHVALLLVMHHHFIASASRSSRDVSGKMFAQI